MWQSQTLFLEGIDCFGSAIHLSRAKPFLWEVGPVSDCWLLYCSIRHPHCPIQTAEGKRLDAPVWGLYFCDGITMFLREKPKRILRKPATETICRCSRE